MGSLHIWIFRPQRSPGISYQLQGLRSLGVFSQISQDSLSFSNARLLSPLSIIAAASDHELLSSSGTGMELRVSNPSKRQRKKAPVVIVHLAGERLIPDCPRRGLQEHQRSDNGEKNQWTKSTMISQLMSLLQTEPVRSPLI